MAKKSMVLKQQAKPKFPAELTTAARSAAVRTLTCVISVSAVSASASWLTRARSRVSARHPGKEERFQKGTRKGSFFYALTVGRDHFCTG